MKRAINYYNVTYVQYYNSQVGRHRHSVTIHFVGDGSVVELYSNLEEAKEAYERHVEQLSNVQGL